MTTSVSQDCCEGHSSNTEPCDQPLLFPACIAEQMPVTLRFFCSYKTKQRHEQREVLGANVLVFLRRKLMRFQVISELGDRRDTN